MANSLLIVNATLVNEGRRHAADVLIRDGRIEAIADSLSVAADRTIDAAGKWLLPGMIDDQVHFREPGLTHKGDIGSESRAAVAGGITSFMEMPNTNPQTLTLEALEAKYERAAQTAWANYAFYLGASNDNLEEIKRLPPKAAAGIKIFMGASTGNMLVDDETTLRGIFAHAHTPVTTHCEDTPMIQANLAAARERWGDDIPIEAHPEIRSREACLKSSSLAVELAREYGTALHVLHLTTADEMHLFEPGPIQDKQITAEVCVHHLWFCDEDYPELGNRIKCNPAIKTAADRAALREALREGRLDVIATDHAPHTREEKDGNYAKAAAGLPLVQDALPALLELVDRDVLSLELVVEKTSHNVARRFQVVDRGFIREGYWADLVLVDPESPYTVEVGQVAAKCGWSPFEGQRFASRICCTIVSGSVVYEDGHFAARAGARRLEFFR
ncbi:MAG: dihydroorotase [Xanthomonadales bacterium]|nr:dihydroorotase [Xanthomonadales bacterium]